MFRLLPVWARPGHPVLRYIVQRERRRWGLRVRIAMSVLGLLMMAGLAGFGYRLYTAGELDPLLDEGATTFFTVAYLPLLLVQVSMALTGMTLVTALGLTSPLTSLDQQRETWELAKSTTRGAEIVMGARWVGVYYYMGSSLLVMVALRVVFAGQLVADLLADDFSLSAALKGSTPAVSSSLAVALLLLHAVAVSIQPLVLIGLNAALGLYISTFISHQLFMRMAMTVLLVVQFIFNLFAFLIGTVVFDANPQIGIYGQMEPGQRWGGLFLMSAYGDLGLRGMNLGSFARMWEVADYALLLGPALALLLILEIVLICWLLRWTMARARRPSRRG